MDLWPELNGLLYSDLPTKVKSGLDRRSISSIILLNESATDEEDAVILRQLVFERLNTGGIKLERQEIRNSLGKGQFNDLLFELSRNDLFRHIWGLPVYQPEEKTNHKLPIFSSAFYKKMQDVEVVLRFFALRHIEQFRYGIQGFLDIFIVRAKKFDDDDCKFLGKLFEDTLTLAYDIYGDHVFKIYDPKQNDFEDKPAKSIYDAVMVPLSKIVGDDQKTKMLKDRNLDVIDATKTLFREEGVAKLTGKASTKKDVEDRINYFERLFATFTA